MNNAQIQDIEDPGIKLVRNYYVEEALTKWKYNAHFQES